VAANEFAVPVLSYSFGVLKWNVDELKHPDQGNEEIDNSEPESAL
jgi:hypothetical protein